MSLIITTEQIFFISDPNGRKRKNETRQAGILKGVHRVNGLLHFREGVLLTNIFYKRIPLWLTAGGREKKYRERRESRIEEACYWRRLTKQLTSVYSQRHIGWWCIVRYNGRHIVSSWVGGSSRFVSTSSFAANTAAPRQPAMAFTIALLSRHIEAIVSQVFGTVTSRQEVINFAAQQGR